MLRSFQCKYLLFDCRKMFIYSIKISRSLYISFSNTSLPFFPDKGGFMVIGSDTEGGFSL